MHADISNQNTGSHSDKTSYGCLRGFQEIVSFSGSSALIRNIPSLPSDHPLDGLHILEKDEEEDAPSSESSSSQSEEEDDEIEIRPSVESLESSSCPAPRKQTNDTDEEPDAEMTSPLSARPSEWADAAGDLATEEEEDDRHPGRETFGPEDISSDERESCPPDDEVMGVNDDLMDVGYEGAVRDTGAHSLAPVLAPIAEEPKTEPAVFENPPTPATLQAHQTKTPSTSPANYSLFKSPFLRLQKKLGVASLFGTTVEETAPAGAVTSVPANDAVAE